MNRDSLIAQLSTFFKEDRLPDIESSYLDFELRYITEAQIVSLLEKIKNKIVLENKANSALVYALGLSENYNSNQKIKNKVEGEGPDIDTDFCPYQVDNLIKSLQEKYGTDRVLRVSTYKPYSLKPSIKSFIQMLPKPNPSYAGETYSINDGIRLAEMVPESHRGKFLSYQEFEEDENNKVLISKYPDLFSICKTVDGQVKEQSIHACAYLIGNYDIDQIVPVRKVRSDENNWFNITQWEGPALEKLGFIKFDILRTDVLTINKLTCDAVGLKMEDLEENIPLDDPEAFALINKGFTAGLFQMEETYLLKLVSDLKPKTIEDLALFSAINRPGPRDSGLLNDYVRFKKTGIFQNKLHPLLDPILKETGGVLIYQEQVMAACQLLAGLSLSVADRIRKAMGKKDQELMNKYKEIFIQGAKETHNLENSESERIWLIIASFAEYGFNKSHALAYAYITYFNAYLKAHYTTDFMIALMTCRAGKPEKLVRYINEYRQMGFIINPPDVNLSDEGFSKIDDKSIYFGLKMIKGAGETASKAILKNRKTHGPFKSFYDFVSRMHSEKVNAGVIGALAKAGAFDKFGYNRISLVEKIPDCVNYFRDYAEYQEKERAYQKRAEEILRYDFELAKWEEQVKLKIITTMKVDNKKVYSEPKPSKPRALTFPKVPEFPDLEPIRISDNFKPPLTYIKWEFELCKFAITRHPLSYITKHPPGVVFDSLEDVMNGDSTDGNLLVAVSSIALKEIKTGSSKGKMMATLTIEDYSSMTEITLFANQYEEMKEKLGLCSILFFKYKTKKDGDFIKLFPVGKILQIL